MQSGFAADLYIVLCSTCLLIIRENWNFVCKRSNNSKQGASDIGWGGGCCVKVLMVIFRWLAASSLFTLNKNIILFGVPVLTQWTEYNYGSCGRGVRWIMEVINEFTVHNMWHLLHVNCSSECYVNR